MMPDRESANSPRAAAARRPLYDGFAVSRREGAVLVLVLLGIHLTNYYNYLLFHSLVELFSVCIAVTISIIAVNCRHLIRNAFIVVLGISYFFVGWLDLFHALSYKSMSIFTDYDYYAPQFWIAARYLESLSMLAAFLFLGWKRSPNLTATLAVFSLVTGASVASILYFKNFPVCFVAGHGLTSFKIASEFAVCGIQLVGLVWLFRRRRAFDARVYHLFQWSAVLMIASELAFTLYTTDAMSDAFNELGHLFKVGRFFLIYKALIVTGLRDPMRLLFRELKKGEESLLEAQQLAQLGSWEWDIETGRWSWTAEIYHLFGLDTDTAPGLDLMLRALPPAEQRALREALDRCVDQGQTFEMLLTISGEERDRYAQIRGRPLHDERGKAIGLVGTILDVSAQQRLMNALTHAKEAADAASKAKSAFLANMSHEIRTPLNAVMGLARIGARDGGDAASRLNFGRILDAGAHLMGVINDILDYAKVEAGKFAIDARPFQAAAFVANLRSFAMELAQQKNLACTVECDAELPEWLLGDVLRLQQILFNLLANAVKFTDTGSVHLRVQRSGEWTRFSVTDTGIGMEAADIARLFKPFEQADGSTTRNYGGTGLGLTISQSLAHLMNGDISVDSKPGQGSTFTLALPLPAVTAPPKAAPETAHASSLAGYRILAAEDVEVNRIILGDLLAGVGASVSFVQNGKEAVDAVSAHPDRFDAVLMDVQMPVMDGYEATRRIRAIAPNLPVVGLTAHALAEERAKCFAAGMLDHVTKPIHPDELVAAVLRCSRGEAAPPRTDDQGGAVPPGPQGTADMPGEIDWPSLQSQLGAKPGLIARLAKVAVTGHGDKAALLRAAAAAERYADLAWLAHALRGAAGNLRAWRVMEQAQQLEDAAREHRSDVAELTETLAASTERLLAELAAHAQMTDDDMDTRTDSRPLLEE
jgi:signal transduction histidine kinase/CheY-like chemotaxis protein